MPPVRQDLQLLAAAGATTLALLALLAVWAFSGFSQPTIDDQLATVQREGSQNGRRAIVLASSANFRGTGANSHVLLFVDAPGTRRPRSDELRIYDEHGDDLERALRFEPAGRRAVFQYRGLADVDFDGSEELIGGFGYPDDARQAIVPFAVEWDKVTERYRLVSLDLGPPSLSRRPRNVPERQYREVYAAPTTFADRGSGLRVTGHRVQDFIVYRASPPPRGRLVPAPVDRQRGGDLRAPARGARRHHRHAAPHSVPLQRAADRGPCRPRPAAHQRLRGRLRQGGRGEGLPAGDLPVI